MNTIANTRILLFLFTFFIFQGNTGDLLKDIFAIFYQPLASVYKAANIGDSIIELAAFIDDLIAFVEQIDVDGKLQNSLAQNHALPLDMCC